MFSSRSACCPYPLLVIPAFLSFVAFIFTWVAATDCSFYSITYTGNNNLRVGLWTVESGTVQFDNNGDYFSSPVCTSWQYANFLTYDDLDAALKTARAFGIIGGVLGTIAFVMILIPSCVVFADGRNAFLLILCGLCIFTGIATLLDLVSPVVKRTFASVGSKSYAPTCFNRLPWLPTFVKMQASARFKQPASYRL